MTWQWTWRHIALRRSECGAILFTPATTALSRTKSSVAGWNPTASVDTLTGGNRSRRDWYLEAKCDHARSWESCFAWSRVPGTISVRLNQSSKPILLLNVRITFAENAYLFEAFYNRLYTLTNGWWRWVPTDLIDANTDFPGSARAQRMLQSHPIGHYQGWIMIHWLRYETGKLIWANPEKTRLPRINLDESE